MKSHLSIILIIVSSSYVWNSRRTLLLCIRQCISHVAHGLSGRCLHHSTWVHWMCAPRARADTQIRCFGEWMGKTLTEIEWIEVHENFVRKACVYHFVLQNGNSHQIRIICCVSQKMPSNIIYCVQAVLSIVLVRLFFGSIKYVHIIFFIGFNNDCRLQFSSFDDVNLIIIFFTHKYEN